MPINDAKILAIVQRINAMPNQGAAFKQRMIESNPVLRSYLDNNFSGGTLPAAIAEEELPEKFHGSQEAARRYAEGYQWGQRNVRDQREHTAKELLPYVSSLAFGPAAGVSAILGEAINMGVSGATNGEKDSWGDLFVDEYKHPGWNAFFDMTNPGYLAVGPLEAGLRPSAATDAGVAALRGEGRRFYKDAIRSWNKYIADKSLSPGDIPVIGEHNLFRGKVYKGGEITDPYFASFTTDPQYAAQYGEVKPYLLETRGPAYASEPLMGSRDVVANDMFYLRNTKNAPGAKAIIGSDMITPDMPYHSQGMEIFSYSPNKQAIPYKGSNLLITSPQDMWEKNAASLTSRYSGYTPTIQSPAHRRFVDDVVQGAQWGINREWLGEPVVPKEYDFVGKKWIGNGAEAFVYDNPESSATVLKDLQSSVLQGADDAYGTLMTPEEAISYGKTYADIKNKRPYNLPLRVVGYTKNQFGSFDPVLEQKKVVVPGGHQYWGNQSPEVTKFARTVGSELYRPELGMYDVEVNNILRENDLYPRVWENMKYRDALKQLGIDYREDRYGLLKQDLDFKPENVGFLEDGTIMGIDIRKNGGFLANPFAGGGDIHIKPSHRGRLTELKARTGKTEAELYNDGNPAHKKMVVFARNARKWKHADGGPLSDTIDYTGINTTNHRKYNPDYISYIDTSLANADVPTAKRASTLANIIEESGGNPFALDDTGKFYGLLQWANNRYQQTGEKDPYKEIDNQVSHILNTLGNTTDGMSWTHGGTGSGYNSYKDAMKDFDSDDLATAMKGFTLGYVRPTGKIGSYNNRLRVAQQLLDRYNSTPLQKANSMYQRIQKVTGGNRDTMLRLILDAKGKAGFR